MERIKYYFCILLWAFTYPLQALPADSLRSLVNFEGIRYNSEFERKAFEDHFVRKKENFFALFSAVSPHMDETSFQNNYKNYLQKLEKIKGQKLDPKKIDRQIKAIYKNAHDSFLRKYEIVNEFSHIFQNGQFNCVSASALYGMIFQDLNIPFTIKEKPTHVYIISYPETHRILVETTDPNGGFYVFDNRYKSKYINNLKQAKLISNEEFSKNSIDQLFDKYYFSDEDIDLRKLVGIQYINNAISKLDEEKPEEAFVQLEKAYLFYPSKKAIFLLQYALTMILYDQDFSTMKNVDYLARLGRFSDAGDNNDFYIHFQKISYDYLVKSYKPAYFKEIFEYLTEHIEDEEIKNEISYIYFFENARILFNKGKYKEALEASKKAFKLKPENSDAQALLVTSLSQHLHRVSDNKEKIQKQEELSREFPSLLENSLFSGQLLQLYLIQFAQMYEMDNAKEGEKYRSLFENMISDDENVTVDPNLIGRAYSLAAVYYFKKGDNARTKKLLEQGLELSPNNHELSQRLTMLKR